MLLAVALVASCKRDVNKNDNPSEVTAGSVTAIGQPESVIDPTTGRLVPAAGQSVALNPVQAVDLRPDAAKTQTAPTLSTTLDPRTFVPSGSYSAGAGVPSRGVMSGQIGVVSDGKQASHPICENAIATPGATATTGLTIDGTLTEWPVGAVTGIDKSGDMELGDVDLTELYFAKDTSNIYLAAKVAENWDSVYTGQKELVLEFRQLVMPTNGSGNPYTGTTVRYYIRGTGLVDNGGSAVVQGTGMGETDYSLAVNGTGIEFRIARTVVETTTGGTYVVNVYSRDWSNGGDTDHVATHLVGLTDAYACLLPVPAASSVFDAFRMVVFRRAGTTSEAQAETVFRAYLAAVQAVDFVAKDHLASANTLVVTALPQSSNWSVDTYAGLSLDDGMTDFLNDASSPLQDFLAAAYAYSYIYADYDYDFQTSWGREGFMLWMANKAVGSYYGAAAGMFLRNYDVRRMLQAEVDNPTGTPLIDPDHWNDAPFQSDYYERKASAYFELISRRADADEIRTEIFQAGRNGWPLADTDDFIHQLMDRHSYKGAATDDLKSHWFQAETEAPTLVPATLFADVDHDGLLAFQETEAGSLDTSVDTDRDGISDYMEVLLGTTPTLGQGLGSLVVDNYLGDWELLAPTKLAAPTGVTTGTDALCGTHTTISRLGAVFVEGWLVVPLELSTVPTDAQDVSVWLTIDLPTGTDPIFYVPWGEQYVSSVAGSGLSFRSPVPFLGKTLELAINASTLGMTDGVWTGGATLTIDVVANGAAQTCTNVSGIAPAETLP